jgi:hypothetical protein
MQVCSFISGVGLSSSIILLTVLLFVVVLTCKLSLERLDVMFNSVVYVLKYRLRNSERGIWHQELHTDIHDAKIAQEKMVRKYNFEAEIGVYTYKETL